MNEKSFEFQPEHTQTWVLVLMLVSADFCFALLHVLNALTPLWNNPLLNIEKDGGYAEIYQYLKYFWTSLLFLVLAFQSKTLPPLAWALVFVYLLADDALALHEQVGSLIAVRLDWTPPWGLRTQDIGEVMYAGLVALVLAVPLGLAYVKSSAPFRMASRHLIQLVFLLACFAVVLDLLHMLAQTGWRLKFVLALMEDGGEMLATSVLLIYTQLLTRRQGTPPARSPWALLQFRNNATCAAAI